MKKLLFIPLLFLLIAACSYESITPIKKANKSQQSQATLVIGDSVELKNAMARARLAMAPGDTLEIVAVTGQSNAAVAATPTSSIANMVTWDDYRQCLNTYLQRNAFYLQKIGPIYYLSTMVTAKFPTRKFIFFQFSKASTILCTDVSSGWRADNHTLAGSYNLTHEMMNNLRSCIDAAGQQPTFLDFIWIQGEDDANTDSVKYLAYEKKLYDTIPQFLHLPDNAMRYYTYLLHSTTDPKYQSGINWAKQQHALQDSRIILFSVGNAAYSPGIHLSVPNGQIACADTLVKKIK